MILFLASVHSHVWVVVLHVCVFNYLTLALFSRRDWQPACYPVSIQLCSYWVCHCLPHHYQLLLNSDDFTLLSFDQKCTLSSELMQARTLCTLDFVLHFKRKMCCAYFKQNKVIFCGYFNAKWGQCVSISLMIVRHRLMMVTAHGVCIWNQSHDAWFPSHWQPGRYCYIRSKHRMAHRSWLQRRGRLQAHQPTYSCNCTMSHWYCLQIWQRISQI